MNYAQKIITAIELHSVEGIRECFANGINPNDLVHSEPLLYELTSQYTRSPRFKDCVRAFVENGLVFDDPILLSVLLDDAPALSEQLKTSPKAASGRYTLRCAYTPLFEASLLHICAEFNHRACAEVLVKYGLDINERAGFDENGFGGQTPIFHTVNQNGNQSSDMLFYLLSNSADLSLTIAGLVWGVKAMTGKRSSRP
jgi:hypothetical protein